MATKNLQKQVLLFSNPTNKMVSLLPSGTSPAILAPKIDSAMRKGRLKVIIFQISTECVLL